MGVGFRLQCRAGGVTMKDNRPRTFEEAQSRFRSFLRQNVRPEDIWWLTPRDLIHSTEGLYLIRTTDPKKTLQFIERQYYSALESEVGVEFEAICYANEIAFATLRVPEDGLAAERALIGPGTLKFSARTGNPKFAVVQSALMWRLLKWRYRSHNEQLRRADQSQ